MIVQVVLEPSWQETLRNLKKQADILLLVTLGVVEEPSERRYHVFEQIINCNLDLDFVRDIVQIGARIAVKELIPIISLVVVEVTLYTLLQRFRQWLPVVESLEAEYPVV